MVHLARIFTQALSAARQTQLEERLYQARAHSASWGLEVAVPLEAHARHSPASAVWALGLRGASGVLHNPAQTRCLAGWAQPTGGLGLRLVGKRPSKLPQAAAAAPAAGKLPPLGFC